jgi:predicted peroxiredoxin
MRMLLVAYSDSEATENKIEGLAKAALARGHEVTVFLNGVSVKLVKSGGRTRGFPELVADGVRLLVCRTSAAISGIETRDQLVGGAEMSSLSELVDLMEESGRVLFLGQGARN